MSTKILEALAVLCELTGTQWSKPALQRAERELASFPEAVVLRALDLCGRELTGRLSLAEILERVELQDGRPSPEQAWATALKAMDEWDTVLWTDEIGSAYAVARRTWDSGNNVGARIAFLAEYSRLVRVARERRLPAQWYPSLGFDTKRREQVIREGVTQGLLPAASLHVLGVPYPVKPSLPKPTTTEDAK